VRYVASADAFGQPDLVFLPGSKNTMGDLLWMRQNGLEAAVKSQAGKIPVCGICGGYQMMGEQILDPDGVEMGGSIKGMGLLPVKTRLQNHKVRRQVKGAVNRMEGIFSALSGLEFEGYEIHMGNTKKSVGGYGQGDADPVFVTGSIENVCGTYVHGIFDKAAMAAALVGALAENKGVAINCSQCLDHREWKEKQYDKLAGILSEYLNMEAVYGMLGEAHIG